MGTTWLDGSGDGTNGLEDPDGAAGHDREAVQWESLDRIRIRSHFTDW